MATRTEGARRYRQPTPAERARRGDGSSGPSRYKRLRRRYAVVYVTDGPIVRLGILWFAVAAAVLAVGPLPTGVLYGGAAAVAAAQTARAWRRQDDRHDEAHPNELVAAGLAGAIGLGACLGAGGAGLAVLVGVAMAAIVATGDTASPNPTLTDAGWTLQCALPPGLAAMSMVLLTRLDQGSALALLLLVSAYETGDFIVGSGSRNPFEGPVAGLAAVVVVTFIVSTLPISALDFSESWILGGLAGLLAPAGQLVASALLPAAAAPASALRRLDSLLLSAPLWCFGVGLVIQSSG